MEYFLLYAEDSDSVGRCPVVVSPLIGWMCLGVK